MHLQGKIYIYIYEYIHIYIYAGACKRIFVSLSKMVTRGCVFLVKGGPKKPPERGSLQEKVQSKPTQSFRNGLGQAGLAGLNTAASPEGCHSESNLSFWS